MEDRFSKMSVEELQNLRRDAQKELDARELALKQKLLIEETDEVNVNLSRIDVFLSICSHTKNNDCDDKNLKEDVYHSYESPHEIHCIRCYLLSCKKYDTPPSYKLTLQMEPYQVYGKD